MVEKSTKTTPKKTESVKDAKFEPTKATFTVAAVAAISLVILGIIAATA
ncbi:MAG TPA: hypothetical protein VFM68_04000 [Candidatus Saccharimonadales bacterium]|nr:hypothetical protein [Candidatus Saccharimonadales bacterium]